jgi:hypothetical protein
MEQIVAEPQGSQPRKNVVEVMAEVVQFRTFREVAGIHPPSMKKTRVTNEKQRGAQLRQKIIEQEAGMSELRLKAQEQETTLKSQTELLEALKKSTIDMHNLI